MNIAGCETLEPPRWVADFVGPVPASWDRHEDLNVRVIERDEFVLVSVRARDAIDLDAAAFEWLTCRAYELILDSVGSGRAGVPLRLWNGIPGILEPLGDLPHRYMVFNAGRFAAYTRWRGGRDRLHGTLPTATGVGHGSRDLVVHCLAAPFPGDPVENPRQVAAYMYSQQYGPRPPCFARGTRIVHPGGGRHLLVGGTASVRGEHTVHTHDLDAQFRETMLNLAALVDSAGHRSDDLMSALASFVSLRVYCPDPGQVDRIRRLVDETFGRHSDREFVPACLCRPGLQLEIEGVADLRPSPLPPMRNHAEVVTAGAMRCMPAMGRTTSS